MASGASVWLVKLLVPADSKKVCFCAIVFGLPANGSREGCGGSLADSLPAILHASVEPLNLTFCAGGRLSLAVAVRCHFVCASVFRYVLKMTTRTVSMSISKNLVLAN